MKSEKNIFVFFKNATELSLRPNNYIDIYNDEKALFFKCLPGRTYAFKGDKCIGGKHSKKKNYNYTGE